MIRIDEYIHQEYGTVMVAWRDERGYHGAVPYAFEVDMCTPDSEVEDLTRWMRSVRLDRSISVSAIKTDNGGPFPW